MEKKIVLLVLILIAVVAFMALGGGLLRKDRPLDPDSYQPGKLMSMMDTFFSRRREPFQVARMTGCNRIGNVLTTNLDCAVVIDTSEAKSSAFVLRKNPADDVRLCFALSLENLNKCNLDASQHHKIDSDKPPPRFVVTSDSAYLHVYCLRAAGGAGCRVTVE